MVTGQLALSSSRPWLHDRSGLGPCSSCLSAPLVSMLGGGRGQACLFPHEVWHPEGMSAVGSVNR